MRRLLVLVLVLGCKKEQAAQGRPGPPVAKATSSDAGAKTVRADAGVAPKQADVDLLHALKVRVAVSSVVANPKMSPYDLFDDTMSTAWNSRTGDLAGAWVAFRMPPSAHVKEIRLTVGFTAKGKEGDYFTMNQRIGRVAIWHDGVRLREVDLDVNSRALQSVPVDANGGDYKLEVVSAVPGSKKTWREICISELQVIGQPPPGVNVGNYDWTPELAIGSLDGTVIESDIFELSEPMSYDSVDDFCKDVVARPPAPCEPWDHACEAAPAAKNECGGAPPRAPAIPSLPAGWKGQWVRTRIGNTAFDVCAFVIEAKGSYYVFEDMGVDDCTAIDMGGTGRAESRNEIRVSEMMGDGGEPELSLLRTTPPLVYASVSASGNKGRTETFLLCAAGLTGIPHCNSVHAAWIEKRLGTGPGDDGYDEWNEYDRKRDVSVDNGVLTVKNVIGTLDEYDIFVKSGRHAVRIIE